MMGAGESEQHEIERKRESVCVCMSFYKRFFDRHSSHRKIEKWDGIVSWWKSTDRSIDNDKSC